MTERRRTELARIPCAGTPRIAITVTHCVLGMLLVPLTAAAQLQEPYRPRGRAGEPLDIEPLATLTDVFPMAFSEDGQRLFVRTKEDKLAEYDIPTGQTTDRANLGEFSLLSTGLPPGGAVVAPGGKFFAAAFPNEHPPIVKVFDLLTGEHHATYPFPDPTGLPWLLFSPRGERLVIYTNWGRKLRNEAGHLDVVAVNGDAGETISLEVPTLTMDNGTERPLCIAAMNFDATGQKLGIVWDLVGPASSALQFENLNTPLPNALRFDVVDLQTGETLRRECPGGNKSISSVGVYGNGRFLIGGTRLLRNLHANGPDIQPGGRPICVLDMSRPDDLRLAGIISEYGLRSSVAVAPNERRFYTAGHNQVTVWRLGRLGFEALGSIPLDHRLRSDAALLLSPDGNTLVTSHADVLIWDVSSIDSPDEDFE